MRRRRETSIIPRAITTDTPPSQLHSRLSNGLIGAAVAAYAFLDDLVLGPIGVGLATWLPWYVTFGVASVVFSCLNVACCAWLQRSWETWSHGHGARVEAMLAKKRRSRLLRRPVAWITRDSDVWFTIAAGLIGTIIVVAVARLSGSRPLGLRRIVFGSVAYSVGFAATYTGVGVGIGDLVRAF